MLTTNVRLPEHVVITGGTIDSRWDGVSDTVVTLKNSVVPEFIESLKLSRRVTYSHVCMKDSRALTEADLRGVVEAIDTAETTEVVVTHGTYTMPDTVRFIRARSSRNDQVVVLTGAMIPLTGFTMSDAGFNLGFAMASMGYLDPGTYVAMNGRVFQSDEVMKMVSEGTFLSVRDTAKAVR